jgi:predicted RNA-binding protein with PIN domain
LAIYRDRGLKFGNFGCFIFSVFRAKVVQCVLDRKVKRVSVNLEFTKQKNTKQKNTEQKNIKRKNTKPIKLGQKSVAGTNTNSAFFFQ